MRQDMQSARLDIRRRPWTRSMDPGSTLPILSPLGSMELTILGVSDGLSQERFRGELFVLGFGCFCWLSFWAPMGKRCSWCSWGSILGNNAEASLRNLFWLGRCPQGFLGNISGTFRGYFWEIFLQMFEHWAIFFETSLGIFWVNIPGGFLKGTSWVIFLRTWLGLNFPWNLWPTKYHSNLKYFKLHSSLSFHQTLKVSSPQGSLPRRASSWKFRAT